MLTFSVEEDYPSGVKVFIQDDYKVRAIVHSDKVTADGTSLRLWEGHELVASLWFARDEWEKEADARWERFSRNIEQTP